MPIKFACPHCQHESVVADQYVGQTGPCANCGSQITIPHPGANPYSSPIQQRPVAQAPLQGSRKRPDLGTRMLIPVDRSVLSIIAGYCGIFSILCFPAPFAILLGGLAVWDIKKSNGQKHGLGRAWFAIAAGLFFTIGTPILIAILTGQSPSEGFYTPAYKE